MPATWPPFLQELLEGWPDLLFVLNSKGTILAAGIHVAGRLTTVGHLPGQPFEELLTDGSRELWREALARVAESVVDLEVSFPLATGECCTVLRLIPDHSDSTNGPRVLVLELRAHVGHPPFSSIAFGADPLTGVSDRARMHRQLESLWANATRNDQAVWVFVADLDRLKSVNDRFGHVVGDEVLRTVAHALTRTVRASDVVARYGGDEFLVAGSTPDPHEVEPIARRIVEAVRSIAFTPNDVQDVIQPTISLGGATFSGWALPPIMGAIQTADQAMYRAKAAGGDRIELWRHTGTAPNPSGRS